MKISSYLFALLILHLLCGSVFATEFFAGGNIEITREDTIPADVYAAGETIFSAGTIKGDAFLAARYVHVAGWIDQDVIAGAEEIEILGTVFDDVRVAGRRITIRGVIGDDLIAFAQEVIIDRGAVILGNIFIRASTVRMDGTVQGHAEVSAGDIHFGGKVGGNAEFEVQDNLLFSSEAKIFGDLTYEAGDSLVLQSRDQVSGEITYRQRGWDKFAELEEEFDSHGGLSTLSIIISIWMIAAGFIAGSFLLFMLKDNTLRIIDSIKDYSIKSFVLGVLWLVLTPLAIIVLFILIATIPVSFLMLLAYLILLFMGYVIAAVLIGDISLNAIDRTGISPYLSLILGLIILSVVGFVPYLGFWLKFVAVSIGIGGMMLRWSAARARA